MQLTRASTSTVPWKKEMAEFVSDREPSASWCRETVDDDKWTVTRARMQSKDHTVAFTRDALFFDIDKLRRDFPNIERGADTQASKHCGGDALFTCQVGSLPVRRSH